MPIQRPENFRFNPFSTLATGLMSAGLGFRGSDKTTYYRDSSLYGNHGVLTNMDPATDWVWDDYLGRWGINDRASTSITLATPKVFPPIWTCSLWCRGNGGDYRFHGAYGNGVNRNQMLMVRENAIVYVYYDDYSLTSWATTVSGLHHWAMVFDGTNLELWKDGVSLGAQLATGTFTLTAGSVFSTTASVTPYGNHDLLIHNRVLSPSEISQLAYPSNVMLSGLLLPPTRKLWSVATTETPLIYSKRLTPLQLFNNIY
jgi:hypothetical protein